MVLIALLGACSLVAPGKDVLSSGECSASEKLCGNACVAKTLPDVGCAQAGCTPCSIPHAAATCSAGKCAVATCELGYADCNGALDDGCETDLRTSSAHCGSCNHACSIPNALAECVSGECHALGCDPGHGECDANPTTVCETDLSTDPAHCGACDTVCALPGASQSGCAGGSCIVKSCQTDRANCNGQPADGCEITLSADSANCGACGLACSSEELCEGGSCAQRCPAIRPMHGQAHLSVAPMGFGVGSGDFTLEAWLSLSAGPDTAEAVFAMNEQYVVSGVAMAANSKRVACHVLSPNGEGPGSGTADVGGDPLPLDHWTHLACVRTGSLLTLYVDGKAVNAGPIGTDLLELSPFAIGLPAGYSNAIERCAPVTLGPIRFSKVARYQGTFTPTTSWPVDADTVAQFLTTQGFVPSSPHPLLDEAGGDNVVTNYGGFAPALAGVACAN